MSLCKVPRGLESSSHERSKLQLEGTGFELDAGNHRRVVWVISCILHELKRVSKTNAFDDLLHIPKKLMSW